jgi:hypothetical protein
MTAMQWLEALSYLVTIVGLPFAIWVFVKEQGKERLNDDEELYLQLSDEYSKFLRLVLNNADLHLMTQIEPAKPFDPEQIERRNILFEILISIFERAYILVYEENMDRQTARLWQTWDDYSRSWCRRSDFRELLPTLLEGEDADFQSFMRRIATEESGHRPKTPRTAPASSTSPGSRSPL